MPRKRIGYGGGEVNHESESVRGILILHREDSRAITLKSPMLGGAMFVVERGLVGVLKSFSIGGGIGTAEKRAYNSIVSTAKRVGASTAVINAMYKESDASERREETPSILVDYSLYRT